MIGGLLTKSGLMLLKSEGIIVFALVAMLLGVVLIAMGNAVNVK